LECSASLNPEFRDQHEQVMPVSVTTVDRHLQSCPEDAVDMLQIDVESMEHSVLEGARTTLADSRPKIILEILEDADLGTLDTIRHQYDYRCVKLEERSLVVGDVVSYEPRSLNQLLWPEEKLEQIRELSEQLKLEFHPGGLPNSLWTSTGYRQSDRARQAQAIPKTI
ncbi:MAG: FkbM family methyltransferase, partial [Dehalococcoidia bacterium]